MSFLKNEDEARAFVANVSPPGAIDKIEEFASRLVEQNKRQNLVAEQSLKTIWMRHLADSAQLLDHVSRETSPWLDLGSGAGLPGVVIAILDPDREVILTESRGLRIGWLREIIEHLQLPNARVAGSDVRSAAPFAAGVISARAFAPLAKLLSLALPFSTPDTEWVLPKGRSASQELANLPKEVRKMFHVEHSLTDKDAGILVGKGQMEMSS